MGRAERRVWPSLLQTTNNGAAGCSFRRRRDHHTMQGQSQGQGRPPLRLRPRRDIFSANLEIVVQINSGQALVHSVRSFAGYRRIPVSDLSWIIRSEPETGTIDWLRFRSPIPCARAALAPPIRSGFGRDCDSMMDEH